MDRQIEKKTWTAKRILAIFAIVAFLGLSIYAFWFMDVRSTLNVDTDRLTIAEVREDTFQEFIQVTGAVQPIQTIYLDAVEGGVVQQVNKESGANVQQGDTILVLSNSDLQLRVMTQTTGLYDQISNVQTNRLNLEQRSLSLKEQVENVRYQLNLLKPRYERQKKLYENNLISEQDFEEVKEEFIYQQKRFEINYESFLKDSIQSEQKLNQLDDSEQRMLQNLNAIQKNLDNLAVRAPISGQLSTIELNQGQSINRGERIGQVDILDNYKVRVAIDEYHLSRIIPGLSGTFTFDGQTHALEITKIYPVINNGQFEVDMEFVNEAPSNLRRGQTLRIRLELGESASAVQIPRGGFYQTTGGNWVFVVNEVDGRAYRRDIRLGRQNPEYFEVQFGLEPGEKVITSSYDTFGDNEVLVLE